MRHPNVFRSIRLSVCLAIGVLAASIAVGPSGPAEAREGNRTLKLYFGHTKERGEFTFKRNGRYDKKEIARINQFLRDWRRNEPANMDPRLLDLVWAINKEAGGREHINVVSAYRSLKTNNMLRTRSRGVAEKSQHTAGRAMDFFIPGVPLAKLRAAAMKFQSGGVGYYPTSGSPFVHVDTGSVRYWPRMPRKQLLAMFPNGETLYLPSDGKPLQGYDRALARNKSSGGTALAYLETGSDDEVSGKKGGNWLKRVFSGGADEAEDNEGAATAAAPAPAPAPAAPATAAPAAQPVAPVPAPEPGVLEPGVGEPQMLIAAQDAPLDARLPRSRPGGADTMMMASLAPVLPAEAAPGSLLPAAPAEVPAPRSRPDATLLAQSLDATGPAPLAVDPNDAIALLSLSAEPAPEPAAKPVQVAALSPDAGKAPPSQADLAAIDAFAAIDEAAPTAAAPNAVPMPRPRPLAMAFAASGLPAADPAPSAVLQPPAAAPRPAKGDRIAAVTPAKETAAPKAVEPAYDADQDTLRDLLGEPAPSAPKPAVSAAPQPVAVQTRTAGAQPKLAPKGDFGGLAMPQPDATPEFFAAPPTASSVAPGVVPVLPTDRFQPTAAKEAPAADESFFSKLFASLAE